MKCLLRRVVKIDLIAIILLTLYGNVNATTNIYNFTSKQQEAQFSHLLKELRCLVCQNQDLNDSNADLAKDLREEVYNLVTNNQSDSEIIHYLTTRYGDFILFKPPVRSITLLLWYGPLGFFLFGMLAFLFFCIKRRA